MPETVCPQCRATVPVEGGTQICPQCGTAIATQAITAATPAAGSLDSSAIAERRTRRFRDMDDIDVEFGLGQRKWKLTQTGLRLTWWSALAMLLTTSVANTAMIAHPMTQLEMQRPGPIMIAAGGLACVTGICGILWLVGIGLCCTAPDPSAKTNAFLTVAFIVLYILTSFAFGIVTFFVAFQEIRQQGGPGAAPPDPQAMLQRLGIWHYVILAGIGAWSIAATWCWLRFHAAVATAFEKAQLSRFARIAGAVSASLLPISLVLPQLPMGVWGELDERSILRVQSAVGLAVSAVVYGLYLVVCGRLIGVVSRGTAPAEVEEDDVASFS
jgi:hypothetical protein